MFQCQPQTTQVTALGISSVSRHWYNTRTSQPSDRNVPTHILICIIYVGSTFMGLRVRAHQGNLQPHYPRNASDFKQATGFHISRPTLRKHVWLVPHVILSGCVLPDLMHGVNFNFVHLSSAVAYNNTNPVIIWWWLRQREKRGRRP
jgi:hypothetical protein